jgi:hypothetical protein
LEIILKEKVWFYLEIPSNFWPPGKYVTRKLNEDRRLPAGIAIRGFLRKE